MKRVILATLSAVAFSVALVPVVRAEVTPFNVVNLARNGYFREQGIPSHSQFLTQFQTGRITADDIVKAAIEANRLPADAIHDDGFVRAVEEQIRNLQSDR